MERCMHGMVVGSCSHCNKKERKKNLDEETGVDPRTPRRHSSQTNRLHVRSVLPADVLDRVADLFVAINPNRAHEDGYLASKTGIDVTQIHFSSLPYTWVVEKVIQLCPNLRTIQTTESFRHYLETDKVKEMVLGKQIGIQYGTIKPPWSKDRKESCVHAYYVAQQKFFLELSGDQKALFDELIKLGFEEAEIASRYFCLHGEPYVSKRQIAIDYGLVDTANHISIITNSVIRYLDNSFTCGKASVCHSRVLERKVQWIRAKLSSDSLVRTYCEELGIESLPQGLPYARWQRFKELKLCRDSGRFSIFSNGKKSMDFVLIERYGLLGQKFKTLEEVAQLFNPTITRERVRQLEEQALGLLGIVD